MSDFEAVLRWLVVLSVVSLAFAPLTCWLGQGLAEARYGLIRPLSAVLLTAILWWPAALIGIPFTRPTLALVCVVVAANGWIMWRRRPRRENWRALIAFEVLWFVLFAGYALFRSYNPDIANTEKPMEIALLSSVSRSAEVPAPDPWFAGEAFNYYYFGYQVIGSLVKLSGVPPTIGFNLALATLFASLGTVAAALGYRLATAFDLGRRFALLAVGIAPFFLILAGNLETALRIIRQPVKTLDTGWWYDDVGWQASRVIVDHGVHGSADPRGTINEFPAFSFVLGDLHPHVLTYPLLLAIVALLVGIICTPYTASLTRIASVGGLIGLLYVSNSWDAPIGMLLLAGALVIVFGWRRRQTWYGVGIAALAAFLAALPFLLDFTAPVGIEANEIPEPLASLPIVSTVAETIGVVTWRPSSVGELLIVHGHWLLAFAVFAAYVLATRPQTATVIRRGASVVAVAGLLSLAVAVIWAPAVVLLGIPLALAIAIVVLDERTVIRTVAGLFAAGFFLTLVPEFVYIQDTFRDRMNTVFKLYFQAWLLFSIASAVGISIALASRRHWLARIALVLTVMIVLVTAPYAPISARDWTTDFAERRGLDGAEYLHNSYPDEAAAIAWLRESAGADVVIVEGPGCSYQTVGGIPMNRFSAFTGVPTIVGWAGHERQWRRGEDELIDPRVDSRQENANRWLSGENASALDIPEPTYIVLGVLERSGSETCESLIAHNTEAARASLEGAGWLTVFSRGNVVILAQNP